MNIRTFVVKEASCPSCNRSFTRATNEDDIPPCPGDLTICVFCEAFLEYTEDMGVRQITTEEYVDLLIEERRKLDKLLVVVKQIKESKR